MLESRKNDYHSDIIFETDTMPIAKNDKENINKQYSFLFNLHSFSREYLIDSAA